MSRESEIWGVVVGLLVAGCGGGSGRGESGGADGVGSVGDGSTGEAEAEADDDEVPEIKLDTPDAGTMGGGDEAGPDECASYVEEAEAKIRPADIIFIVDNSGSMQFEAESVQANLNSFSQQITDSGIDVRVVLISSFPGVPFGICVDPPLGSGGCPTSDSNPPVYTHIDQWVNSNDALFVTMNHSGVWSPLVRPDSSLHFVVVSDDESWMDVLSFDTMVKALQPNHLDYKFHGIVSMTECEDAAALGNIYVNLAKLTGGIASDLCDQNFQPVFDQLAAEVIEGSQITCAWPLPMPDDEQTVDPDKVNVEFDDGSGPVVIGRVDSQADCEGVADGWYYDDPANPTQLVACPQTCEKMQQADSAKVDITLGCETIPAG